MLTKSRRCEDNREAGKESAEVNASSLLSSTSTFPPPALLLAFSSWSGLARSPFQLDCPPLFQLPVICPHTSSLHPTQNLNSAYLSSLPAPSHPHLVFPTMALPILPILLTIAKQIPRHLPKIITAATILHRNLPAIRQIVDARRQGVKVLPHVRREIADHVRQLLKENEKKNGGGPGMGPR